MVLDKEGVVTGAWELQEESSAIVLQDKQGTVWFVKEGALNNEEIQQVLTLIKDSI